MEDSLIVDLYFERNEQAIAETQNKYGRLCTKIAAGILKRYEINSFGVYLDKELKAEKPLCHFHTEKDYWTLRFAVNEDSGTPGGLTLFGSKFGDYPQDIYVCVRYE